MKKLILLRHAKSSWDTPASDRFRPLKQKGERRIKWVSEHYRNYFDEVDKVFCSPALRAHQTAELLVKALSLDATILSVVESLYTFDSRQVLDFIHSLDDALDKVVLVGHNPAFTDCIETLGNRYLGNLPTASFGYLSFTQNSWKIIQSGNSEFGLPEHYRNET